MKGKILAAAVGAFLISAGGGWAGAASADDDKGDGPKVNQLCKADVEKLCPGLAKTDKGDKSNKGAKAKCLRDNEAKLSPDCAKAVAAKPASWGRKSAETAPAPQQ